VHFITSGPCTQAVTYKCLAPGDTSLGKGGLRSEPNRNRNKYPSSQQQGAAYTARRYTRLNSGRRGQARQADRSRAVAPHAVITVVGRGGSVTGAARGASREYRERRPERRASRHGSRRDRRRRVPPRQRPGTPITSSHDKAAPMPSRKCKSRSLDDTSQASQSRF